VYLTKYFKSVDAMLKRIRETQLGAIREAAGVIADSLAKGGALAVMDTGHMLKYEALCRAGGLMVIAPFAYTLNVENTMDQRTVARTPKQAAAIERRTAALALDNSKLKRGDVLIINSNSGRTANVIETALQCKPRGIRTIGISSVEQMRRCSAAHPSGKKLFDVADICVDNCGPHGDALVAVRDNENMCPGSGLAATYVFWAIQAEVVERLQAMGVNPTIFRSVHVSGHEYIDEQRRRFLKDGI